jgi:hypothetical protein
MNFSVVSPSSLHDPETKSHAYTVFLEQSTDKVIMTYTVS